MEIKIKLGKTYGKLINTTETLSDEQVVLKFESDYVLAHAIVRLFDGKNERKFECYDLADFVLPDEYKKAGELYIGVDLVAKGKVAKHFDVEPLVLKEVDSDLQFIPEIVEQNRKIFFLEQKVSEFQEQLGIKSAQIETLQLDVERLFEIVEQQP